MWRGLASVNSSSKLEFEPHVYQVNWGNSFFLKWLRCWSWVYLFYSLGLPVIVALVITSTWPLILCQILGEFWYKWLVIAANDFLNELKSAPQASPGYGKVTAYLGDIFTWIKVMFSHLLMGFIDTRNILRCPFN